MGNPHPKYVSRRCSERVLREIADQGRMWSGLTYQKPFNPQSPDTQIPFRLETLANNNSVHNNHRHLAEIGQAPRQPAFTIYTAVYQARLFRTVHASINLYCGARGNITAKSFLTCLKRYFQWKAELPPQLDCESHGERAHPSVLTLQ